MSLILQRKEQLHKLKLQEAAAKASQGIAHKEQNQAVKLAEGTAKVPRINRQKLGLPSMNPLANTEVLGPGQKRLPGMVPSGTDTVPAMLTPGEAVIPAPAAQDPKNKKAIKRMVNEGRKANKENKGVLGFEDGTTVVPSLAYAHYDEPGSSFIDGSTDVQYYENGSTNVSWLDKLLNSFAGQTIQPTEQTVPAPTTTVPEPLLKAQRIIESNNMNVYPEGHAKAGQLVTSPKGALGIAQIMPKTAADPGFGIKPLSVEDLKDENKAIRFQNDYMSVMSSRYNGDMEKALTAYNAGYGNVDKAVLRAQRAGKPEDWKNFLPTQEAKDYANKVMGTLNNIPVIPPAPGTGFVSNAGGAAFGNPNVTRQAAKSVPRQQAIAEGRYEAVPNIAETTPAMSNVVIPSTRFDVPAPSKTPEVSIPESVVPVTQETQKDTAALDAMIAGFSKEVAPQIEQYSQVLSQDTTKAPEEKKSLLERFIANIYGEKGSLFNEQDLARFALVAAGGMITGADTGRSLRYAAKDVLSNADKRAVVQTQQEFEREKIKAVDDRTERNKLIDQGYELSAIDKYLKSRQIADLGNPRTTYSFKETGKQVTIDRGPQSGMTFQVVEATTKTGKGVGDTTLMVIDPRTNNKVPYSTFQSNAQKLGYNVVDYSSSQHSPLAKANRVKEWVEKDATTIADQAVEQVYGASNVKGKPNTARANVPTSSAMGAQAASFFKSIGFEPSDSNEMLEAKNIMNVAVQDMITDQQGRKVKVSDLTPYLSRSMITVRSGINPDLFKIGVGEKSKVMPPEKIVQLDYLVKQASSDLSGGQTNPAAQQALYQKMANAWNNNPKLREKYAKPGPEESSFYMFMKDTLTKGLKD